MLEPGALEVPDDFKVIAIVAARNEADIISSSVGDLVGQGVEVYLIDDQSSDGTVAAVSRFRDRGLIGIEATSEADDSWFSLRRLIRRKQELAVQLEATWFINHDVDEFREGPWPGLSLRQAIFLVDQLGFNAIDFEVLDFWPTHDDFEPGGDPREAFTFFAPSAVANKLQIRCWKRSPGTLDLLSSGGHEAIFAGRRVFPIRFILRHYAFRGQAHGERKLFEDRRPRYAPEEVEDGWHLQHRDLQEGASFVLEQEELRAYDPLQVRLSLWLHHRSMEEYRGEPEASRLREHGLHRELALVGRDLDARNLEMAELHRRLDVRNREVTDLHRDLDARNHEVGRLQSELCSLYRSWSWRLTAPLRAISKLVRGR